MPSDLLEYRRGRGCANTVRPLTHPVRVTERRAVMQPSNTPEEWRPVVGYEDRYEVSDHGRVRTVRREFIDSRGRAQIRPQRLISACAHKSGHLTFQAYRDYAHVRFYVHRVVLEAFVGPCPVGMEACHENGDPTDNRLSNLRWDTRSKNMLDAVRHGTHQSSSKTHCKRGHEFTPQNTYNRPGRTHRVCNTCRRINRKRRAEGDGRAEQ